MRDSQNPDSADWQVVHAWPYWKIPVDYAIVTRVMDPTTEQVVVVAAGITHYGTQAAGRTPQQPGLLRRSGATGAAWLVAQEHADRPLRQGDGGNRRTAANSQSAFLVVRGA